MLRDEVQSLLKRYDEEKGRFRKAAGYIPIVGAYYSQTATIKQIRETNYTPADAYWLELFNILNQYQRPAQRKKTVDIVEALRVALLRNTPWQDANELFMQSLVIIQKSNIFTPAIFFKLAEQFLHSTSVSEGLRCLADGSDELREIEELELQKNLLNATHFYLLLLNPAYADRLAIGIRYLNLANIDTQLYIDLLVKYTEHADVLGHGFYELAKHGKLVEYGEELCHEPDQALHKARQLCGLELPSSVAPIQTSTLSDPGVEQTSSTQAAASAAIEQDTQPASAQPIIPEKAVKILRNAGLADETNLKHLRQNPSHAKSLANGFCALHREKILNKKNRALLLARPDLAEITAIILCKLRSMKALSDKKRLVIVENYDSVLMLAYCIDFLEQSFAFTKESMELLFEQIKDIQIVFDTLTLLDGSNLLNPVSSALVLELLKTKHIEALRDCLDLLNDKALLNSCDLTHKIFKPEHLIEFRDALTNAYLTDSLTDTTLKDLMQAAINPAPPALPAIARQASNLSAADSKHSLASSSHTFFRTASLQALKGKARPFSVRFTKHLPEELNGEDITKLRSTSFANMSAQLKPQFR